MKLFIGILFLLIFCFYVIVKPIIDLIKKRQKKYKELVIQEKQEKELERQRLEKIRLEIEYEKWKQDNPEYDPNKDPVAQDYLKDKRIKPMSTREKLEREFIKKRNNPELDLFLEQDFELHMKRLKLYSRSKWRGEMYYMGKKGGIYTLSSNGTRNYKY
tara:strand:- start:42 stop:518 length:477 start_codon:yes stop_codon:yes gene_type:complete